MIMETYKIEMKPQKPIQQKNTISLHVKQNPRFNPQNNTQNPVAPRMKPHSQPTEIPLQHRWCLGRAAPRGAAI